MSGWTGGYFVDTPYTASHFRETAPSHLRFAALLNRREALARDGAARCLELGCGVGFNAAVLAASNPDQRWTAVDLSPAHIAAARRFQELAGVENVEYVEASFEDLLRDGRGGGRGDPYDYVCLHGVYSWISDANARLVREILAERLGNGGVAYVSYNCQPGWSELAPLRRLMVEHAARRHAGGDTGQRARAALGFLDELRQAGARALTKSPATAKHLERLARQEDRYLAHEYLAADWRLLYHADVAAEMAEARLAYLGSADLVEALPKASIPAGLVEKVKAEPDRAMAETLRDFAVDRRFRRDVYDRGAYALLPAEREAALRATRIVLTTDPSDVDLAFKTPIGTSAGKEELYRPFIRDLADGPASLGDLAAGGRPLGLVEVMATMLVHAGHAHPVVARDLDDRSRERARRFNLAVARRVAAGDPLRALAAPLIGAGLRAPQAECLAYLELVERPDAGAGALADAVADRLRRLGTKIRKEGRTIEDPAETRRELLERMEALTERKLPVWRRLGVI